MARTMAPALVDGLNPEPRTLRCYFGPLEKTGLGSAQVHDVDDPVHEVGDQQLVAQEAALFQDDLDHLRALQGRQEDHGVGQGAQGGLGAFEGQLLGFAVDQAQPRVVRENGGDVAGGTRHGRGDERAADAAAGIFDHEAGAQIVEAVDDDIAAPEHGPRIFRASQTR